jgi:hypothetical protein
VTSLRWNVGKEVAVRPSVRLRARLGETVALPPHGIHMDHSYRYISTVIWYIGPCLCRLSQ